MGEESAAAVNKFCVSPPGCATGFDLISMYAGRARQNPFPTVLNTALGVLGA